MTLYIPTEVLWFFAGWGFNVVLRVVINMVKGRQGDDGKPCVDPNSGYKPAPKEPRLDPPIPPRSH